MMLGLRALGYSSGDSMVDAIAQAISQQEGNGPANISTRNNNPGNLRSGVGSVSKIGMNGGYAVFADMASGWQALYNQINLNIGRGLNLYQFFAGYGSYGGYAPSADNNKPVAYANYVAAQTGLDPNIPLNQQQGGIGTEPTGGCDPTVDSNCYVPPADASVFAGLDTTTMMIMAGVGLLLIVGLSR